MSDEEKDKFVDTELGPDPVRDDKKDENIHLQINIDKEDDKKNNKELDSILIKEIKQNISRNSLEIADLKNKNIDSGVSEDSNPITPREDFKHPEYVFANIFNEPLDIEIP